MIKQLDVVKSCDTYATSIQTALDNLLNIHTDKVSGVLSADAFEKNEDIYFSILFTGQIYGEFIIGINRNIALEMLGMCNDSTDNGACYEQNRFEILDTFKEIINIAAGKTLTQIKEIYPEVSITPPRSIEGHITLSKYDIKKSQLHHKSGPLTCYIYIDLMQLDVAAALQNEHKQQIELKRLNTAKTEFLANMSHELRTPLNGMIGMLDLLKASSLSTVQQEQINIVCKSGDFLLSIINDILEFSKIESGKLVLENRPFAFRECIESVAESLSTEVFAKGLNFYVDINPEIYGLYEGDETRVKQILVNLVGNAIKFTPTGHIQLSADLNHKGHVEIKVSDTGVGIPASKMKLIFDSFSQAEVSDKRKYGGSGLGLTISKSIVEAMGGQISVNSQEAKGSEFAIELPNLSRVSEKSTKAPAIQTGLQSRSWILSDDEKLNGILKRNLTFLFGKDCAMHAHDSQMLDGKDIIFIDYKTWSHLDTKVVEGFTQKFVSSGIYVLFFLRPQDVHIVDEILNQKQLTNFHYLTLPFNRSKLSENILHRPTATQKITKATTPSLIAGAQEKTVLLVEDVQVNQVVATAMLKSLGYKVKVAENGLKALEYAKASTFDFILMDCQMPEMDGYEATIKIREFEKTVDRKTPIVALTANAFRETKERCFECGMNDFITKPFKLDDLKSVILRNSDRKNNNA